MSRTCGPAGRHREPRISRLSSVLPWHWRRRSSPTCGVCSRCTWNFRSSGSGAWRVALPSRGLTRSSIGDSNSPGWRRSMPKTVCSVFARTGCARYSTGSWKTTGRSTRSASNCVTSRSTWRSYGRSSRCWDGSCCPRALRGPTECGHRCMFGGVKRWCLLAALPRCISAKERSNLPSPRPHSMWLSHVLSGALLSFGSTTAFGADQLGKQFQMRMPQPERAAYEAAPHRPPQHSRHRQGRVRRMAGPRPANHHLKSNRKNPPHEKKNPAHTHGAAGALRSLDRMR